MNETTLPSTPQASSMVRWTARSVGALFFAMLALVIVAHGGLPNLFAESWPVRIESVAMMTMFVSYLVGWRWQALGGILNLGAFAVFVVTELVTNGQFPGGAIPFLAIPGLLFIASYWISQRESDEVQ